MLAPQIPGLRSETWGTRRVRSIQTHIFLFRLGDSDQQDVVAGQFDGHVVGQRHLLAGPEVFAVLRAVEAELGEIEMEGMGGVRGRCRR